MRLINSAWMRLKDKSHWLKGQCLETTAILLRVVVAAVTHPPLVAAAATHLPLEAAHRVVTLMTLLLVAVVPVVVVVLGEATTPHLHDEMVLILLLPEGVVEAPIVVMLQLMTPWIL